MVMSSIGPGHVHS